MANPLDTLRGKTHADIGRRLKVTREYLDVSQVDFAASAGLKSAMMSRCESGDARLSVDAAILLCERYDLTLDWIFRGQEGTLEYDFVDGLLKKLKQVKRRVGEDAAS